MYQPTRRQRLSHLLALGALALTLAILIAPTLAQDSTPTPTVPAPMRVEVQAADGLTLVGDLYNAELDAQTPAVLLMHMYQGRRTDWRTLLPALTGAGYHVISVDLRGHGETGGDRDWQAAVGDVQTWLDWMETQPSINPDKIGIIGASIGANLALVGCANDTHCLTAVALSPGTNYLGVTTTNAIKDLRSRSALLVASQTDEPSSSVRTLTALADGEVGLQLYRGGTHGTLLLVTQGKSLIPMISNWLDTHLK